MCSELAHVNMCIFARAWSVENDEVGGRRECVDAIHISRLLQASDQQSLVF